MIFSARGRTDFDYAKYSEPIFSYLNRSAQPLANKVRNLIEYWFSHYPKHEQADLLGKLQSNDDQQFLSAFFELYLHKEDFFINIWI